MHYLLSSFMFYIHVVLVRSSEDWDSLWPLDGEVTGTDNLQHLNGEDEPLLSNYDPFGDQMWDLNDEPASEAAFPLENTPFSDLTSVPVNSLDNEKYAMVLENPSTDDLADPLRSDDQCLDPSNIPIGRSQTRSTEPGLDVCAFRKEGSPPLNVPSNLRLEDVQRVPGFVPLFRGMSDSCIVYSEGMLPFGVCSSTQPEDSLYSREERFFGLLTWQLTYCTLGKFFPCLSLDFVHPPSLAAWREHQFHQPLRL